jgi:probable phosphoglycerate mutase
MKNPDEYQKGKTIVYFVRHGDRIHIPGTCYPHDFSLSSKGKKQAKNMAKNFLELKDEIDIIYSSPMKRAYETALEIGKQIKKKPIILRGFEEIHKAIEHKSIFSKKYWQVRKEFNKKYKIFNNILEKNMGKVVLIVAHGRLNRMLFGKKLGLSHKKSNLFDSYNCHISRLRFNGKKLDYIYYINSGDLAEKRRLLK